MSQQRDAEARRARARRWIMRLLVLDLVVIACAAAIWMLVRREDDQQNAVNEGLRGSRPPGGQTLPELAAIPDVDPPVPAPRQLRGAPTALAATCIDCRSGDVIGGFLGRLEQDDLPDDAQVHVVVWDGDSRAWRERWGIGDRIELHEATTDAARAAMRRQFGIGPVTDAQESGVTYLYDTRGRWRSSFYLGQLDRDDLRHDLEALAQ